MFIKSDSNICSAQFIFNSGFIATRKLPQLPHVVEHLVMDAPEIREVKARAALVNAHTTETQISFEMTCLSENFSQNVELFLRAFSHIQIENFAKNLAIVRRELETVAPARILLENNLNKLAPEIFADHAEHVKSLDQISENDARDFWRENLATKNMNVIYSAPHEEKILPKYEDPAINPPLVIKPASREILSELRADDKSRNVMKTIILPYRTENAHDFAALKLYASILNRELGEKFRAQGLIYSLSMSVLTDLIREYALINVSFRALNEDIDKILGEINSDIKISSEKFEFYKKRFLLNFAISHQTATQKIAFAREQMNSQGETLSTDDFTRAIEQLNLSDIAITVLFWESSARLLKYKA